MTTFETLDNAFSDGYDVGFSGGASELCPFNQSEPEFTEWLNGWAMGNAM